jgi:hypothetical protein
MRCVASLRLVANCRPIKGSVNGHELPLQVCLEGLWEPRHSRDSHWILEWRDGCVTGGACGRCIDKSPKPCRSGISDMPRNAMTEPPRDILSEQAEIDPASDLLRRRTGPRPAWLSQFGRQRSALLIRLLPGLPTNSPNRQHRPGDTRSRYFGSFSVRSTMKVVFSGPCSTTSYPTGKARRPPMTFSSLSLAEQTDSCLIHA